SFEVRGVGTPRPADLISRSDASGTRTETTLHAFHLRFLAMAAALNGTAATARARRTRKVTPGCVATYRSCRPKVRISRPASVGPFASVGPRWGAPRTGAGRKNAGGKITPGSALTNPSRCPQKRAARDTCVDLRTC